MLTFNKLNNKTNKNILFISLILVISLVTLLVSFSLPKGWDRTERLWKTYNKNLDYDSSNSVGESILEDAENVSKNDKNSASIYFFRNAFSSAIALNSGLKQHELNPEREIIFILTRAQGYIMSNPHWDELNKINGITVLSYDVNNPELEEDEKIIEVTDKLEDDHYDERPGFIDFNGDTVMDFVDENISSNFDSLEVYLEDLHTFENFDFTKNMERMWPMSNNITFISEGNSTVNKYDIRIENKVKEYNFSPKDISELDNIVEKSKNEELSDYQTQYVEDLFHLSSYSNWWVPTEKIFTGNDVNRYNFTSSIGPRFYELIGEWEQNTMQAMDLIYNFDSTSWEEETSDFKNHIISGSRIDDDSIESIIESIGNIFNDESFDPLSEKIWFKGHPGQEDYDDWFKTLRDEVEKSYGSSEWFYIANHTMPMELFFASGKFRNSEDTLFSLTIHGSSTVLPSSFEANGMDSISEIFFVSKEEYDSVIVWFGDDEDILPHDKIVIFSTNNK